MAKKIGVFLLTAFVVLVIIFSITALIVPSIRESITWRFNEAKVRIDYMLNPPQESVFVPNDTATSNPQVTITLPPTAIPSITPTESPEPEITNTPEPTSTPLPGQVLLSGVRYMDQHGLWNYCAPSNLAMALSFWGWEGDRYDTGQYLKPFEKDKNVMLYEMAEYTNSQTNLKALVRTGGTLPLLKKLIASGYPVLIE